MLDFEVWYAKARQDELWQQVAACTAAYRDKGHRPPQRHRWLLRLNEFLAAWGLRAPALLTPRLAPAVVRGAQQKHGGSNVWQHR
jgi:hypothetical protein